jgi:hypothetical protein
MPLQTVDKGWLSDLGVERERAYNNSLKTQHFTKRYTGNTDITTYMFTSHNKNAGKFYNIVTANRYFKNIAQFKYL